MQNIQIGLWTFVNTVDSGTERKSKEGVDFFRLRCLCTLISEANKCEKMKLHIYAFVLLLSKPYPLCPEKLKGKKKQTNEKNILRDVRVANENNNF